MRALIVTGIWPPDVGGPAVHAPALADALMLAGHDVSVVTTAGTAPEPRAHPIRWVSRRLPAGLRHAAAGALVARSARHADVVYATSMVRRAATGAAVARRPLVVKLVADEAYERARRSGAFDGSLDAFQHVHVGRSIELLRSSRTRALRRAVTVVSPSEYLRKLAIGWGVEPDRVVVVPNPAPAVRDLPAREALRAELGVEGLVLGFAGRLTAQKSLDVALAAVARVPAATLVVLGDGPEREPLARRAAELGLGGRARFVGAGDRDAVLRMFGAADAALLTSAWENLPHTVLEALAVGTPVIATAVGGVPEVVHDGVNGLLVPAGSVEDVAAAIARVADDEELRERLRAGARPSVEHLGEEALLARIVELLERAAGG